MTTSPDRDQPFETPPAPVYTGDEPYDARPIPRIAPPRRPRRSRGRQVTVALTIVTGLWLLALAASQATSATVAVPFLERTLSALADVPALLRVHEQAIRRAATQPGGDAPVPVPGFPVPGVTLPRAAAQTGKVEDWQALVLRSSAEAVYQRGPDAFAPGDSSDGAPTFATSRWVRLILDLFSAGSHATASWAATALGLAMLALAVAVLFVTDGVRRFVALGLGLVGGAVLATVGSLLGLLVAIAMSIGSDSVFVTEVGMLVRTVAWTPIHDALRVAVAGIAILVPSAAVAGWIGSRSVDRLDDGEG